ncbi:MAG: antibiotic biosynthesis monooxygenase [Nannocystaceae bacterium]
MLACAPDEAAGDDATDAASGSEGAGPTSGGASESGASDGSSGASSGADATTADLDALYDCVDPGLVEARPLSGPGFDPATGLVDAQDSYVVSTTQILPIPEHNDRFLALVAAVGDQLESQPGLVAYALAVEPTCGFARTMSVWRDETSMLAFVGSGAHADAMTQTFEVGVTGRVTHFVATAEQMPISWELAIASIAEVEPL